MKISESQIEQLYKFTRQHFVVHYDVQTELVDHLANDIEEMWKEQPKLTFEQARDRSFRKFGVFGFMDVVEAKEKQMNQRYWKIVWRFMKEWFTVPKLFLTGMIFSTFLIILRFSFSYHLMIGFFLLVTIFEFISAYRYRRIQRKTKSNKEKTFLLETIIGTTKNGVTGLLFLNVFNIIQATKIEFYSLELHWLVLISFASTLMIIIHVISNYVLPQKAEELLKETYPEYNLIK